jgi:hypothetical protein
MHFLRNRAKLSLAWGLANNFSEAERFTDWEPVPASRGPARAWRFAAAHEAVRDASLPSRCSLRSA